MHMKRSHVKRKSIIKNLVFTALTTLSMLILIEIGIRLIIPKKDKNTTIWINHPVLGYSHCPNHSFCRSSQIDGFSHCFKTDRDGFVIRRNPGPTGSRDENHPTIMMLGDSMLQGNQVSARENMSVLLENLLSGRYQTPMKVTNLGANGYCPLLYMLAYRCYREKFNPKLVIAVLTIGNDFNDDARFFHDDRIIYSKPGEVTAIKPKFDYANGLYWKRSVGTIPLPWEETSFWSIRIIGLVRDALDNLKTKGKPQNISQKKNEKSKLKRGCADTTGRLTQRCYDFSLRNSSLIRNNLFAIFKAGYTEHDREDIQRTLGYLSRLRNEVEADGKSFLLVILPMAAQIKNQWEIGKTLHGLNLKKEEALESTAPQKILLGFCKREHIDCLDMLPVFRANSDKALYWVRNTHLTQTAHALVANEVAAWLMGKDDI
jgi:hypothetical protein